MKYVLALADSTEVEVVEGQDVSDLLNIKRWVAEIPANLAGEIRGMFPSWIPKTDQERVQNLSTELADWQTQGLTWELSEKLEGSSMTVYLRDDDFGVCSRNLDLRESEGNTLWAVARRMDLENLLRSTGRNLALQGELVGEGIQSNIYKLKGQRFYLFDIYDINAGEYLSPLARRALATQLNIPHVPVFDSEAVLSDMQTLLDRADGKSVMGDITGPWREGLVYKCNELPVSFKTISNLYLLKTES
jgi:RNA ligase (TIGR02306 family)